MFCSLILVAAAAATKIPAPAPAVKTAESHRSFLQIYDATRVALIGQGSPTDVSAYIRSEPSPGRHYTLTAEIGGGLAEQIPGDKVAVAGFAESSLNNSDIWGANFLTNWRPGDPDINIQGAEVDFNNFNRDSFHTERKMKVGINVTSGGTKIPGYAMMIGNTNASNPWRQGLVIQDNSVSDVGINVGAPALSGSIVARQIVAGGDTLLLQRRSDSNLDGDLIRGINAANNRSLFRIRASGRWQIGDATAPSYLHVSGSDGNEFQAISFENTSPDPINKGVDQAFYGRDTKGNQKLVAKIDVSGLDGNWNNAAITLYAIDSNHLTPVLRLSNNSILPLNNNSAVGSTDSPYPRIYAKDLNLAGIPVYSDNKSASDADIAIGEVYRTPAGQLMVRY